MKLLRHLLWPVALLPALLAFVWTGFASRLPEPEAARRALGEATMRWHFPEIQALHDEPAHLLARAVHIAALQIPGSTFWWAAAANAVLALLVVFTLAALARRALQLEGPAVAFALGVAGLLVCSPAFGADWLHGDRVGLFLVPWLLLAALRLLLGSGRFPLRSIAALLLAMLAPFAHTNGLLVFVALAPAVLDAARRAGSSRRMGWIVALLLVGNLAAIGSMASAGGLALGPTGLLGRLAAAPSATVLDLLRTTGSAWLDPLPSTQLDELALGALAWAFPLLFWFVGDRSEAARTRAAPWWGCVWFGLSLFVLVGERHGGTLPAGALRELTFGAFLLPIGCLGVLGARFGAGLVPVGAGVLLVLSAQDVYRGVEDLRLARQRNDRAELLAQLPATDGGVRPFPDELQQALEQRGWIPHLEGGFDAAIRGAAAAAPAPEAGAVTAAEGKSLRGVVRSSLTGDNVLCVAATLVGSSKDGGGEQVLGLVVPDGAGLGRNVPWTLQLAALPAAGSQLRVVGYRLRSRSCVLLGIARVAANGALVVETRE